MTASNWKPYTPVPLITAVRLLMVVEVGGCHFKSTGNEPVLHCAVDERRFAAIAMQAKEATLLLHMLRCVIEHTTRRLARRVSLMGRGIGM